MDDCLLSISLHSLPSVHLFLCLHFPGGASGKKKKKKKNTQGDLRNLRGAVLIPGQEDPLKEGMATHSSILAWRMPCTEEPGGLLSVVTKSRTQLSD